MFKENAVKRLAQESRVKLSANMRIKGNDDIPFANEEELFQKINSLIFPSLDQDCTYAEIDFKYDPANEIKFPDAFECVVVDNSVTRDKVQDILKEKNLDSKIDICISTFPKYRKPQQTALF